MKLSFVFLLIALPSIVWGQKTDLQTQEFAVTGLVKKEMKFTLAQIDSLEAQTLPDVAILNHAGESRGMAKQLKGVLVKNLLQGLALQEDSPKRFSEFYLVFVAADGYKVVYSWNEIFNSPIGDNLYFITAKEGKTLAQMDERILVLTPIDFKTGRRHIKALSKIVVSRAE